MLMDKFNERVREIDVYYEFLHRVTVSKAALIVAKGHNETKTPIDRDLVKILKANAFLLLYNLVESSIREGITYIYDSVRNDRLTYKELRDELRQIWIQEEVNPEASRLPDSTVKIVRGMVEAVIADGLVLFDPDLIPVSGNLDARKVRELAGRYGFAHTTHRRTKGGEVLLRVKTERNNLAHGQTSFVECGRDLTYSTLKMTKTQLVLYVSNILRNIDSYVGQKAYKKT
jgi:MAE_28990/MAE_18760-like HEPN